MKKALATLFALIMAFTITCTAFATETDANCDTNVITSIQPRIGIGGYGSHYGTSSYEEFTIKTDSIWLPMKEFSIRTSGFNDDTSIRVEIYNSSNQMVTFDMGHVVDGNQYVQNINLNTVTFRNGDTYTIKYNVYKTSNMVPVQDDGTVEIWIF